MANVLARAPIGLVLAALVSCTAESPPDQPASDTRDSSATARDAAPNILLILVDDMGYSDIGAFGAEIATPNIDALAYSGVRFSNFHAGPTCVPSRAMLLTGMSNHGAGLGDMEFRQVLDGGRGIPDGVAERAGNPSYAGYLRPAVATLPEVLRENGYRTYMTGKWDLGRALVEEHIPYNRGFDRAFSLLSGAAIHLAEPGGSARGGSESMYHYVYRRDDRVVRELPNDFYSTRAYADEMIGFLREHQANEQPFFAYFAPTAPHWPLQIPDVGNTGYQGAYDVGYEVIRSRRIAAAVKAGVIPEMLAENPAPVGERVPDWDSLSADEQAELSKRMEIYASMLTDIDSELGRIVSYLESTGDMENTLVLFMSDNGADNGPPPDIDTYLEGGWINAYENLGHWNSYIGLSDGWAHATMTGLRGLKGGPWEGGTRVTAFAAGAGVTQSGHVEDQWLSVMDVMPTLLAVAEAEHPSNSSDVPAMIGRSFASLFHGEELEPASVQQSIPFEFHRHRWIVQDEWKAVRARGSEDWQLYNLESDPAEQTDIARESPEILDALVADWEAWSDRLGVIK